MSDRNRKQQVKTILTRLLREYPAPKCALNFKTPFELLTATILSAQTTDVQVNKVTPALFRRYRSVKAFAEASLGELTEMVSSVNFYRNKARNIQGSARMVRKDFNSRVPQTMEELITLPGVARKTANIILSDAYGVIEGIAVDTHVLRLSARLGLSSYKDPVKVERDLMKATPRKDWAVLSHLLILHGRNTCGARKPMHDECVLKGICPSSDM